MEDVFKSINQITKTNAHTQAYHESMYDAISEVSTEEIHKVSYKKGKRQYSYDNLQNSFNFRKQNNSSPHNRYTDNSHSHGTPTKMKWYYCEGEYCINECEKFKKDKDKYNLSKANLAKKYKENLLSNAKKSNISVNEAALSSQPKDSTYSIEQAKQLIRGMQLSDTNSDSEWLGRVIKEVTVDEVSSNYAILYKVKVNNTVVEALYDTGASIRVMSHQIFNNLDNKPNLIPCNRSISGAGGGVLTAVGECFISVKMSSKVFRDRVIVIKNLKGNYILGQVLHRDNRFGTGYTTNGRHYIT